VNHSPILLGTSSFTVTGWQGSFYPKGLRPADYLSYYAQHFDTVEIDSTFYATPNVSVVRSWNAKTPEGFLFAAKVPQEITHKRVLKDCDEEFKVFLTTMEALGEKLGPLLFQFGKFDKYRFKSARGAENLDWLPHPRGFRGARCDFSTLLHSRIKPQTATPTLSSSAPCEAVIRTCPPHSNNQYVHTKFY